MQSIGDVALDDLLLDPKNPRLPLHMQGQSQEQMLRYLFEKAALEEIALSIAANGYFASEPVIVGPPDDDGKHTVLEGNRRLATALILDQEDRAQDAGVRFRFINGDLAEGVPTEPIGSLPAVLTEEDDEFQSYLGFRHISGLRMWGAAEKARYIWACVNKAALDGDPDQAFYAVGRTVGSNSRGVRSAYVAYDLLANADGSSDADSIVNFVLAERFGVWVRLLGTQNVANYIGFAGEARNLDGVRAEIAAVNGDRLLEVLQDLRPVTGKESAVIKDSREVTAYSDVIANEAARSFLRDTGNLAVARSIVKRPELESQIVDLVDRIQVLTTTVTSLDQLEPNVIDGLQRLAKLTRALASIAASLTTDD